MSPGAPGRWRLARSSVVVSPDSPPTLSLPCPVNLLKPNSLLMEGNVMWKLSSPAPDSVLLSTTALDERQARNLGCAGLLGPTEDMIAS